MISIAGRRDSSPCLPPLVPHGRCDDIKWLRFVPGHAIWHVTVSYGFTMMLLLGGVRRADNFQKKARIWRPSRPRPRGSVAPWWQRALFDNVGYRSWWVNAYFDIMPEFAHVNVAFDQASGFENVALSSINAVRSKTIRHIGAGAQLKPARMSGRRILSRSTTSRFLQTQSCASSTVTNVAKGMRDRLRRKAEETRGADSRANVVHATRSTSLRRLFAGTGAAVRARATFPRVNPRASASLPQPEASCDSSNAVTAFSSVVPTPGSMLPAHSQTSSTAMSTPSIEDVEMGDVAEDEHALLGSDVEEAIVATGRSSPQPRILR